MTGGVLPTVGRIVHHRGKLGYQVVRPAIVVVDVNTLDPRGVEAGAIPGLDSPEHVHLRVFAVEGEFTEYNVAPGTAPGEWSWPPRA
jgi:hypothetical protein